MQVDHVAPSVLVPAEYNPRTVTDAQLDQICRSIVEFGVVDPIIARREDNLVLGGHQRLRAIQRLLSGAYKAPNDKGKMVPVAWRLPDGGVPVVYLDGVSDARAKVLNLALNRISGDWDHEQLAGVLKSLEDEGTEMLALTGFSSAELTDYLDLANEVSADILFSVDTGAEQFANVSMPTPLGEKPVALSIEFKDAALRNALKAYVVQSAEPGELSGDTIARLLNVGVLAVTKRKKTA